MRDGSGETEPAAVARLALFDDFSVREPSESLAESVRATAYHYDEATRSLYVLRANDVMDLLGDDRFWSARPRDRRLDGMPAGQREIQEPLKRFFAQWPVFLEGELHDRVRKELTIAVRQIVTPELGRRLSERIAELLDGLQGQRFDWITKFAWPMAALGIAVIVGVEPDDAQYLIDQAAAIIHELSTPLIDGDRAAPAKAAADRLERWLTDRRRDAASPLLTGLGRLWQEAGPGVATAALTQMVTGAMDPIVSTLAVLAQRATPEALCGTDPATLREEVIRLASPLRFTPRYARCPVTVGGYQLAATERVMLGLCTANLDPTRYQDPLAVRPRGRAISFSFGQGRHYCLGATYARVLVDAVIAYLAQRHVVFRITETGREPELTVLRFRKLIGHLERTRLTHPADAPG
ncbi:MAG TPA: cytochrome P450 [Streptosporangiaceae bacterium]|nr:cytochrome P450 [Streptosporangiaceae bacterium]